MYTENVKITVNSSKYCQKKCSQLFTRYFFIEGKFCDRYPIEKKIPIVVRRKSCISLWDRYQVCEIIL